MSEESIQDFIGILNVTMTGLENAGKAVGAVTNAGFQVAKGSYKALERLCELLTWIARSIKESPYNKTGGKLSNKVLTTKFQDLNFSDLRLFYAKSFYTNLNKEYPGAYDQAKIDKLLNPEILKKEFDNLAKKNGFVYAKVPNFIPDRESGVIEYRFAYSKSQEAAMLETKSQMQALIFEKLIKCGAPESVAQKYSEKMVEKNVAGKSVTQNIDELGINRVNREQFEAAMRDTYPKYDPKEFSAVEPSKEKIAILKELEEKNTNEQQKANANVKSVTFSKILEVDKKNYSIKVVLDEYPNVAVRIKNSNILDIQQRTAGHGIKQYQAALRKDATYEFDVYFVNPKTKKVDMSNNPKHYKMTFNEFDLFMKQSREKTKQNIVKLQLPTALQLPSAKTKPRQR